MRSFLATTFLLALAAVPIHAQLPTNQLDNFNRADDISLGMTPTEPTSLQWSESGQAAATGSPLTADETIRINNSRADLQAGQKAGVKTATVDMSNVSGYPTTLDDASGVVTWAFNFRQSKTDPGGFGSTGTGGMLFALAASGTNLDGANAFAVVLGDSGDDPVKLVNYNGGYSQNGDLTKIIAGTADRSSEYVSVKVTFASDTDTWTLYARSSSNGFPTSDPRTLGSSDRIGQQQFGTGTGNGRKVIGMLWDHGATSENAVFDDIYVTDPNGRLPVELTSFDATTSGESVQLSWRTASETNNSGFEVQRKQNGTFRKVGFVEGAGTTTQPQSYRFTLADLEPGEHTFRLRQVDLDGTAHLSSTRSITVQAQRANLLQTSANPVQTGQAARFALTLEEAQPMTITVVDALGRTVRTLHTGRATAPRKMLTVNTSDLSSGVYFLHVEGASYTTTKKFSVVQ